MRRRLCPRGGSRPCRCGHGDPHGDQEVGATRPVEFVVGGPGGPGSSLAGPGAPHRTCKRGACTLVEGLQAFCLPQNGGSGDALSICMCPVASVGQGLAVSVLGLTGPFGRRAMGGGYREAGFSLSSRRTHDNSRDLHQTLILVTSGSRTSRSQLGTPRTPLNESRLRPARHGGR